MVGRGVGFAAVVFAATLSFDVPRAAAADCATSATAADLDAFFGADDAAGLAGADYPHAYALPDGRTLWLFQDAFLGVDSELWTDRFAHNAALVQSGNCFELLPTSGGRGTSWIGSWVEDELDHWFWPLDAEVGADGHLWLFLAEVRNPNGSGAARGARPVATWRARYRLPDLELVDLEPAGDSSSSLFGYSIVSDDAWTYLYGHCYRQYASDAEDGFDQSCSPYAYLARVPKGRLDRAPQYWSGAGWTADRAARQPVLTGRQSMPVSVERFGAVYVAVSDEDDWYGSEVVVRTATAPQGPWTEVLRFTPDTKCGAACNNYGAFVLPRLEDDKVVIAQSNNAWDMQFDSFADASLYRISVRAVDVPGVPGPPVDDDHTIAAGPDVGGGVQAVDDSASRTVAPSQATTSVDASPPPVTPPRETGVVFLVVRGLGVGLAAAVAAAATLGFMTTAKRTSPARRSLALARLRTDGARRAHRQPPGPPAAPVSELVGAESAISRTGHPGG